MGEQTTINKDELKDYLNATRLGTSAGKLVVELEEKLKKTEQDIDKLVIRKYELQNYIEVVNELANNYTFKEEE